MPAVIAIAPGGTAPGEADTRFWSAVAALHADDAHLDGRSTALMAAKQPTVPRTDAVWQAPGKSDSPLRRVVRNFEAAVALDTVRNEYLLHATIHQWLTAATSDRDMEALNARVYADLFLTPASDPWLGLVPEDAYSALDNDGICEAPAVARGTR